MQNKIEQMIKTIMALGAYRASVIKAEDVPLRAEFRTLCENNACGMYGRCWMCPPDVGEIHALMQVFSHLDYVIVYQTVTEIEDSFDFEGMMAAAETHAKTVSGVRAALEEESFSRVLFLGAGGCHICKECAKLVDLPCRYPEKATPSLEAYGVDVAKLAALGGMKYTNGQNTVTYFGAVCFSF